MSGYLVEMMMNEQVDQLCSRHIAKMLDGIDEPLTTRQKHYIKKAFRFFADDIKQQVIQKGKDERGNQSHE